MSLNNRYDFILLFDVRDGNPNGDPDAGNLPRLDAESGRGLVTDVCIKRKIRNFIGLSRPVVERKYSSMADGEPARHHIYVKEKAVLGRFHFDAFNALDISLGEEVRKSISAEIAGALEQFDFPEGVTVETDDEDQPVLCLAGDIDKKEVQAWLKEAKPAANIKRILSDALRESRGRRPTQRESDSGRAWLCKNFFDIRTFGAVLSLKSAPNCGQVRGPVQLTFARSVDPIVALEHSITRMAVATEAEAEKQGGDNRTMGRKHTVPYGLYVAHGFVSSFLAKQTGFDENDLELLWQSLENMFEHDRSAARGEMATRGLYAFKHDSELGNAHAHSLFDRLQIKRKDGIDVPRSFSDYDVNIDETNMPAGVTLIRRC